MDEIVWAGGPGYSAWTGHTLVREPPPIAKETQIMKVRMLIALAGASALTTSANAQFWTTGADSGLLDGISNTGVAAGSSGTVNGQYFTWTKGDGVQSIGGVSPGNGVGGEANISNDGRYISGTIFNTNENYHEMGRYDRTTGTWQGFGMIPNIGQQVDAEVSSGWGISGDGRSVVGLGWTTLGTADTHAMQWTEGTGVIDLGSATVGTSARATAASFDARVVAGWQDGNGRQGAAWVNGVQELIVTDTGTPAQEAFDVSDDGEWVTGMGVGNFVAPGNAYRYNTTTDTYESLPNLASGADRLMAAAAVNGDGSLIGGGTWGFGPATFGNGFIWQEGVGTMGVADYLDSVGVQYDDTFVFAFVSAISEDGNWLAGWGNFGTPASTTSWVVRIPTPSSASLIALGGLVATRRRR